MRVVGVTRNALTAAPLRAAGFEVRCGNVLVDVERKDLLSDADVVVNCASASSLWGQSRIEDRGTIEAALAGAARVVHFSSVAVYSSCVDPARNTFASPRPDSPYGRDKLNLERYATRRARDLRRRLVVLRMGHVYGAEQWVSRFVLDRAGTDFRLPFDGSRPSNAVHVANVASAVCTLVRDEHADGTFNLFDPGQSTWRQVFDWNTRAANLPAVPALDAGISEALRALYARKAGTARPVAIAREVTGWAKSLPMSLVAASPGLRDLAMTTLSALRMPPLEQRLLDAYGKASVRRIVEAPAVKEPFLFAEGAPGEAVRYRAEVSAADAEAVARWHRAIAMPDALFPEEAAFGDRPVAQA